jgi:hypothetical protein
MGRRSRCAEPQSGQCELTNVPQLVDPEPSGGSAPAGTRSVDLARRIPGRSSPGATSPGASPRSLSREDDRHLFWVEMRSNDAQFVTARRDHYRERPMELFAPRSERDVDSSVASAIHESYLSAYSRHPKRLAIVGLAGFRQPRYASSADTTDRRGSREKKSDSLTVAHGTKASDIALLADSATYPRSTARASRFISSMTQLPDGPSLLCFVAVTIHSPLSSGTGVTDT